jgi:2-iminobutanoate/2-iminopropanoate deaminase|tara:strand:+ start:532 stop:972 length:441 start_codon:yes stop_codon:yes gene_type:complete
MVRSKKIILEVLGSRMNKITRLDHADGKPRSYPAATLLADLVFPCGQVPVTAEGTTPETIAEQTVLCLDNLESTLVRAGSSLDAILQITVYLAAIDDFEAYDEAWRNRFGQFPLPPRTTLFVQGFRGQKRIELTAIAHRHGEEAKK